MAETPKHEIEKLLNDYAKQRRDAAGSPEMHPATRQMLHAEVKQYYVPTASSAAPEPSPWWKTLWPRIAVACAILTALGVAVVMTISHGNKSSNDFTLAKVNETEPASDSAMLPSTTPPTAEAGHREIAAKSAGTAPTISVAPVLAETPRPANAPSASKAGRPLTYSPAKKGDNRSNIGASEIDGLASTPVAGGNKSATSVSSANTPAPEGSLTRMAKAPSAEPPVSAVGGEKLGMAARKALGSPTITPLAKSSNLAQKDLYDRQQTRIGGTALVNSTQMFRNVAFEDKSKSSTKLPVLDEFTVRQNGSQLTVIDHDGSVYNGYARPTLAPPGGGHLAYSDKQFQQSTGAVAPQSNVMKAATQSATTQVAFTPGQNVAQVTQSQSAVEPQNYYFRVEGTNRSLNQRVIFTGNLLQNNLGNAAQNQTAPQNFKQQAVQQNLNANEALKQQFQNNYINGQVQLGNSKTSTELNALPVDR